jgi:putative ABC transport system permease protein
VIAVLRSQLRGLARRPGRLLLTGSAVLVAAFVLFGTVLAQRVAEQTVLDTFSGTPAATSMVVEAAETGGIGATELSRIRSVPGVAEAVGRIQAGLQVAGTADGYLSVDADPGPGPLSRLTLRSGGYPTRAGELAVDARTAQRLGVAPGGQLTVRLGDRSGKGVQVTVTGVVDGPASPSAQAYAPDTVVADLLGEARYSRVDVRAAPGVSAVQVAERLAESVGTGGRVTSGDRVRLAEATAAAKQLDQVFALVGMFVLIAVVAAALVATSTFRIVFAQRMRQLALLRAVGAHRGQLVGALTVEGALVGVAAGAAGVLLAAATSRGVPALADAAGTRLSVPPPPIGPGVAVVLGAMLLTITAVLAPAAAAATVSPLQALRSAGTVTAAPGLPTARRYAGLLLAALAIVVVGIVLVALPGPDATDYSPTAGLELIVLSGALAFGALVALGPALVRPILMAAARPLRRLGPTGILAVRGVGGAPRRAAAVSVVVALGVTLIAGTVVGAASLGAYADRGLALQAPADFQVSGGDANLARQLAAAPALAHVTSFRLVQVSLGATSGTALDLDLGALPALQAVYPASGTLADLRPGRVVLAGQTARALHVAAGDPVTIRTDKATLHATVAATLSDSAPLNASAVLAPADLDTLGAGPEPTGVLADAAAGDQARQAAAAAIRAVAGTNTGVEVAVLADARDATTEQIAGLFATALGLLALTVLIAVVGVGTTTALMVVERTREFGLLRALGLPRGGLRRLIGLEAALYGLIGAALGVLLGVPYAWLVVRVLNLGAPLRLPAGQLLLLFFALVTITAVAGLLPARRAVRVSPVAALGTVE